MKSTSRSKVVLLAIFLFAVVLSACGGGGGDSSTPSSIPLKTNTIRNIAAGDTYNYTATGTINNGQSTIDMSGTVAMQILSTTKQSPITLSDCLDQYLVINLSNAGNTQTVSGHSYVLQDLTGTVYLCGQDVGSGDSWVTSPAGGQYLSFNSPIVVGQNGGASVTFSDGSSLTYSYSVIAIESVTTGKGTFEAYRILQNSTYDYAVGVIDRMVGTNTIWYVPGLGGSVKTIMNASYYTGGLFQSSISLTYTLSSTTVAYERTST